MKTLPMNQIYPVRTECLALQGGDKCGNIFPRAKMPRPLGRGSNGVYLEEDKTQRKPDEIDSYEYLAKHLWDRAHRGGFTEDFERLKTVLPHLKRFANLIDLLNYIENGHKRWRNRLGTGFVRLYHQRSKLRPATMELLLLVLWHDLTEIYEQIPEGKRRYGEPFADIYWEVFQMVDEKPRITAGRLIKALRDKFIQVEDLKRG